MKKIFLSLLSMLTFIVVSSQNNLSGKITDQENGEPLEQVSIYFPQLEKGSVTNTSGQYKIDKLPVGSYKVVASYIGFQSYSSTINITNGENQLNITLMPSAIEMEEVIVSTPFHKLQSENVMKVEYSKMATLKTKGATTLAEGITDIPGVNVVSTGVGIGKPVIRGLTSNRVLVYTQGIRLENQQFGDEHGLGVNDAGIESVEVIKGPASLLYGSDAMGGVIYLNPEKFADAKKTEGDLNLNYYSNTQGLNGDFGIRTSANKMKYLLRAGTTSHVDYTTGKGDKVTNSRFKESDIKLGTAYQSTNFKTEVRYNYNKSDLGIPEEIGFQTNERKPDLPFQTINNHILSSKTNMFFDRSSLDLTLGYIFNNRKEFEDAGSAALDMNLSTLNYNLLYHLPKWKKFETIVGAQGIHQTNTNYGEEALIPDATTNDIGFLATSHIHFNDKNDVQLGIRYDHRAINGDQNGIVGEEGYIAELSRDFSSFNANIGYKYNFAKNFNTRLNIASGFRAPNLAELTSNGVHEGTNRYEIGNANLGNEQNLQTDLALEYKSEHLEFYANGFYNTIRDYVFIAPDGTFEGADAVFRYEQENAELYGGEFGFHLHPHPLDWLHLESSYQTVRGKLKNGSNLPLIPANSMTNTLRVEFQKYKEWIHSSYAFATLNSVFKQNKISDFETPTNGYTLLNIGLGGQLIVADQDINVRLSANNLLNENYISHLSRLKTDGILNPGRNISVGLSIPF